VVVAAPGETDREAGGRTPLQNDALLLDDQPFKKFETVVRRATLCSTFLPRFKRFCPLIFKPARCLCDNSGLLRACRSGQVGQEQTQHATRWKARVLCFRMRPYSCHEVSYAKRTTELKFAEVFKSTHNFSPIYTFFCLVESPQNRLQNMRKTFF
jgi:hypothetical protein